MADTEHMGVRLPTPLVEALKARAVERDTTLTSVVERTLVEGLLSEVPGNGA